jgi:hypothetical protein
MGGGGGLLGGVTGMLFGSPSQPATPDYSAAARETAAGNLDAARAATAANRVNQVTPYGSLNYSITGQDPYGNPTWTATTKLSKDQQDLYNYDIATSKGLGALQQQGLGYVSNMLQSPFDTSNLASTGINPGEQMSESIMRRLQPNIQMEQKQFDTQMANQGIPLGSEAYENAKRMFDQRQNDKLVSSIIQGTQTGLQARGQGFSEQAYQRNEPINTLNAVRSGSQVTNPNSFYVNAPQQATTAGADMLGAAGMTGNAAIAGANAENANRNAMMQGLFSLGGAAMMSDIRTKENIKHIGSMANGLPVYEFEYKPEFKAIAGEGKFIGVMAQEVELVQPEAVITRPDGYKMVNYGALQ